MTTQIHPAQLQAVTYLERVAIDLRSALIALTHLTNDADSNLSPAGRKHLVECQALLDQIQARVAS